MIDWLLATGFTACVVVACVGWGRLVERGIARLWADGPPLQRFSTGTIACIGLAASLCGAGVLVAADLYSPWIGGLWIVAGIASAVRGLAIRGLRALRLAPLTLASLAVLAAQALYRTGWLLGNHGWNYCDDFVAYLPFVYRLNDTGGMIEPFSQRRIASLGSASVFDSLFTTTLGINSAYLADVVAGGVLVGLLLLPLNPKLPRFLLGALLVVSFTLWQSLQVNLSPTFIPVALTAAAILVVAETRRSRVDLLDRRVLILVGLLGAALLTLRTALVVPAGLFGLALVIRAKGPAIRERLRALTVFGIAVVIPTVPWMIALWRSSRTPLYPPITGNLDPSWPGFRASGTDVVGKLGEVLETGELAWMLVAIVLGGVLLLALRRSGWPEAPLLALPGALITIVSLVISLSAFTSFDLARYAWPVLAGILVATLALLADEAVSVRWQWAGTACTVTVVATACLLAFPDDRLRSDVSAAASGVAKVASDNSPPEPATALNIREDYSATQDALPTGAKVASASDHPYLFDYGRNNFVNLDVLGSVSPPPGMPLGGSTDAITHYLRRQGFEFVVATDPSSSVCLYNKKKWEGEIAMGTEPYASFAPPLLDWFRWLRVRAVEAPRLQSRHGSLIVLDLRRAT